MFLSFSLILFEYYRCYNEDEYSLALPYYKMARVMPADVLKRVKKVQEQSNNNVREYKSENFVC